MQGDAVGDVDDPPLVPTGADRNRVRLVGKRIGPQRDGIRRGRPGRRSDGGGASGGLGVGPERNGPKSNGLTACAERYGISVSGRCVRADGDAVRSISGGKISQRDSTKARGRAVCAGCQAGESARACILPDGDCIAAPGARRACAAVGGEIGQFRGVGVGIRLRGCGIGERLRRIGLRRIGIGLRRVGLALDRIELAQIHRIGRPGAVGDVDDAPFAAARADRDDVVVLRERVCAQCDGIRPGHRGTVAKRDRPVLLHTRSSADGDASID